MKSKICFLVERLNGGGAERSAGILSLILSRFGYDVYFIILYDDIAYPFSGTLINLGQFKFGSRTVVNKFLRYKELKNEIDKNKFDLILDFRLKDLALRELLLNKLVFKTNMVNMVRSFKLEWYFSNHIKLANYLYKNYSGINTVSFKIQKKIEKNYGFNNVSTIHNPIDLDDINTKIKDTISGNDMFIIAVGRLTPIKQFDKLIEVYEKSLLPKKNIHLYIIGEGEEKMVLKKKISLLNLDTKVRIIDFQENIFKYMSKAKFLVLSSDIEGFPRVLLESLACGTPVIAFDCNSGPSEIITHELNGLLVDNQNFECLVEALDRMENDEVLYNICKKNSLKSVEKFSLNVIGEKWDLYLKSLNLN